MSALYPVVNSNIQFNQEKELCFHFFNFHKVFMEKYSAVKASYNFLGVFFVFVFIYIYRECL